MGFVLVSTLFNVASTPSTDTTDFNPKLCSIAESDNSFKTHYPRPSDTYLWFFFWYKSYHTCFTTQGRCPVLLYSIPFGNVGSVHQKLLFKETLLWTIPKASSCLSNSITTALWTLVGIKPNNLCGSRGTHSLRLPNVSSVSLRNKLRIPYVRSHAAWPICGW